MTQFSRLRIALLACATLSLVAACSDGELTFVCQGATCTSLDDASDALGGGDLGDVPPGDTGDDLGPTDGGDGGQDAPVVLGLFGDPCTRDAECRDGFCIVGLGGNYICTVRCADTCDEPGYACQLIESSGADLVRICYPQVFDLCKPCEQDFECGGLADRCVELQDGTYCGADCQLQDNCPDGFDCRDIDAGRQCVPASNFCANCFDRDTDGYGVGDGCLGTDCNDLDPFVFEGAPELCDFKDNDCDTLTDEDTDTSRDPQHCSGCGIACTLPNAINICVEGFCFIGECLPSYHDLSSAAPGCEYECTDEDSSIADVPDGDFADTDCDGIDGNGGTSIFVSASSGHPNGSGALDDPVDTIYRGIELAQTAGFSHVLVAEGSYSGPTSSGALQPLEMADGISVHGGYDAQTWARSNDNVTIISGATIGVRARNLTLETILSNVTVQAGNGGRLANGEGESSIALLGVNANPLVVRDSVLVAGNGGVGDRGANGNDGADGEDGGNGGTGNVDSSGTCPSSGAPARGGAGPSSCRAGGLGGSAARSGSTGGTGSAAGSVPGGTGGAGGGDNWLGFPDDDGDDGNPGCSVNRPLLPGCPNIALPQSGSNGPGGSAFGSLDASGFYHGGRGTDGNNGEHGYGGGGGGGGGGATGDCSGGGFGDVLGSCDGWGGGGGGGGGAGCAGTRATGGFGGGGSFGLYLIDSAPTVVGTSLRAGNGGGGGDGGRGGSGGFGGDGGNGGASNCNGGDGGDGGDGTDGGAGGHGGGAGGGVSYAIFLAGSDDVNFGDDNVPLWGTGGSPGGGPGNPGARGETGAIRRVAR